MISVSTVRIRVHYPLDGERIVLRTELDWNRDVEPVATRERREHDFVLRVDRPYAYFKPVLLSSRGQRWSIGDNYLALAGEGKPLAVYPYFFDDPTPDVSEILHASSPSRTHAYRVYRPPGYGENILKSYPVLYMHDGQNLFFPEEAFQRTHWRVSETLNLLDRMRLVGGLIVVGIHPRERERDYTLPGYEEYGAFVAHTLKPIIDSSFRTLPGPQTTAVMGSSLRGVVSLFTAWEWPDVFGLAGCLSGTFGFRDDLHGRVRREAKRRLRLYLDSGWPGDNYEVTRAMRNELVGRGYREGSELLYLAFPGALHDERHWAMRWHLPLQFFFGREEPRMAPRSAIAPETSPLLRLPQLDTVPVPAVAM